MCSLPSHGRLFNLCIRYPNITSISFCLFFSCSHCYIWFLRFAVEEFYATLSLLVSFTFSSVTLIKFKALATIHSFPICLFLGLLDVCTCISTCLNYSMIFLWGNFSDIPNVGSVVLKPTRASCIHPQWSINNPSRLLFLFLSLLYFFLVYHCILGA